MIIKVSILQDTRQEKILGVWLMEPLQFSLKMEAQLFQSGLASCQIWVLKLLNLYLAEVIIKVQQQLQTLTLLENTGKSQIWSKVQTRYFCQIKALRTMIIIQQELHSQYRTYQNSDTINQKVIQLLHQNYQANMHLEVPKMQMIHSGLLVVVTNLMPTLKEDLAKDYIRERNSLEMILKMFRVKLLLKCKKEKMNFLSIKLIKSCLREDCCVKIKSKWCKTSILKPLIKCLKN